MNTPVQTEVVHDAASAPAQNAFAVRISREEWNKLVTDPDKPLMNKAIQAQLAPGSVFKLIVAAAASLVVSNTLSEVAVTWGVVLVLLILALDCVGDPVPDASLTSVACTPVSMPCRCSSG